MLAQITRAIINSSFNPPEKPVKASDFMPSEWAKQPNAAKPKRRRINRRAIADSVRTNMAILMARGNPSG